MVVEYRKCNKCNEDRLIYNPETESAVDCECKKKTSQNQSFKNALLKSGLPHNLANQSIESFDSRLHYKGEQSKDNIIKLNKYIINFKNQFKWYNLFFWGIENTTQKTTTACWIGKELLRQAFSVRYINLSSLIKLLTDFKLNANDYLYIDFLIIDNLNKLYDFQLSAFKVFLEERQKATCFISNLPIYDLKIIFNTSIEAIMRKAIPLEFKDIVPPIDYKDFNWDD